MDDWLHGSGESNETGLSKEFTVNKRCHTGRGKEGGEDWMFKTFENGG